MNQYGMNFGMQNMPMQMQGGNMFMNMNMNNMNNMMANNPVEEEEWMKGFTLGVQEVASSNQEEEEDDGSPKINCIFTTTKGKKTNVVVPVNMSIDKALHKYLKRVGSEDLYNQKSKDICFLYNGTNLKYGETKSVGEFFGINKNPNVIVNDVNNLIGA